MTVCGDLDTLEIENFRMRICYYADGRYIHAERWMKYFVTRGHEMHLISFVDIDEDRIEEYRRIGVKYHGSTGNFHLKRFWLTLRDLQFVKSVLRREKIDILHSHFLGTNAWFAALSRFSPHILTVMGGDVIGEDWPSRNIRERKLTPFALRNADVVTSWSDALAKRITRFAKSGHLEVIHGGIELDRFLPGAASDSLRDSLKIPRHARVVFSPRLARPLYNIDRIACAAGIVCSNSSDVYFLIALPQTILDADYVRNVKDIFSQNSARQNVRYLSTIAHEDIPEYFRLSDVTISIPDVDGTPMAVLESMACGTPTVIGDLPDYDPEYFEHEKTTLMVDVKDPRSIAEGVLRLLKDEPLSHSISEEARSRVTATGGYEYQMSKMEAIYRRFAAK